MIFFILFITGILGILGMTYLNKKKKVESNLYIVLFFSSFGLVFIPLQIMILNFHNNIEFNKQIYIEKMLCKAEMSNEKYLNKYIEEYKYELDRPFLYFNLGKSRKVINE